MKITQSVKSTLKKDKALMNTELVKRCVKFTKEIEDMGILKPERYNIVSPVDERRNQSTHWLLPIT